MTDNKADLIIAWLQGRLSPEQQRLFESWRNESEENSKLVDHFRHIWQLAANAEKAEVSQSEYEVAVPVATLRVVKEARVRKLQDSFNFWPRKILSILVVLLSGGIIYFSLRQVGEVTVQTYDNTAHVVLPDGSGVWLNRGSRLIYEYDFDEARSVKLVGEAYFDIASDQAKPFVIHIPEATIKMSGTALNVKANAYEKETEVFVASGTVSVEFNEPLQVIAIPPGSAGIFNKSIHSMTVVTEDDRNCLAWKDRRLFFRETPLRKVIKTAHTYFDQEFEVTDEKLLNCRFTGSFHEPSIEEFGEALQKSLNLQMSHKQGTYVIDGTGCDER